VGMAERRSAAEWARVVRRWRRSGSSTAEFAAAEGVKPSTLSWWAWKLGLSERRQTTPDSNRPRDAKALQLVPVQVVTTTPVVAPEAAVEIAIGTRVVRVRSGFDRETFAAVLEVLAEGDEC